MRKISNYILYTKIGKIAVLAILLIISATYIGLIDPNETTSFYIYFYYMFILGVILLSILGVSAIVIGIYYGIKETITAKEKSNKKNDK